MILKNIQVINHDTIIKNSDVEIKDGKIFKITPIKGKPEHLMIPGFVDHLVHGFGGHDVMDSKEAVEIISKKLVEFGTTSFMPAVMTDSLPNVQIALENIANADFKGAKNLGANLEALFLSPDKKGSHMEEFLIQPSISNMKEIIGLSDAKISKVTFAPELLKDDFIEYLLSNEIIPSIGHTNATFSETQKAINVGANACTHLWNAMSGIGNRDAGTVHAIILNKDNVMAELIADGIHVTPEAIKLSINNLSPDSINLVSDSINPAGLEDGEYVAGGLDVTKEGPKLTLTGSDTIAGSASPLYFGFRNLLNLGYDIKDVVKMTSYNANDVLHDNEPSELVPGNVADFILMEPNYDIRDVYINGINMTNNFRDE